MDKHFPNQVNCIYFKENEKIWANCSDDGLIYFYHLVGIGNKQEFMLNQNKSNHNNS